MINSQDPFLIAQSCISVSWQEQMIQDSKALFALIMIICVYDRLHGLVVKRGPVVEEGRG